MAGMLAIVVSLVLLMNLVYRVVTVLLLAPLMTAPAVILSCGLALLLPIYTHTFMPALANYAMAFLPIFLLGALFGQLMADSGAAHALSARIVRVVASAMPSGGHGQLCAADRWRRLAVRGRVRGPPHRQGLVLHGVAAQAAALVALITLGSLFGSFYGVRAPKPHARSRCA